MLLASLVTAAFLATAPADTVVLDKGYSFLWWRAPAVSLIIRSPEDIRLTLTARDPQFFATIRLALYPVAEAGTAAVAELASDSSMVDARSSTNRHTLYYRITKGQLWAWAAGAAPVLRIGKIAVTLDQDGRERLRAAAQATKSDDE